MKILLLGSGGREHALAWKIAQSKKCEKLFIAPGNAGTKACGENVAIGVNEFEKLKAYLLSVHLSLVQCSKVVKTLPKALCNAIQYQQQPMPPSIAPR